MFTGIVRATARVKKVAMLRGTMRVEIFAPRGWRLTEGGSISVDGICSTVLQKGQGFFEVDYMPETLRVTTASDFVLGRVVNLEQSLRLGDRLEGHFVQGHVDAVARIERSIARGASREITIRIPKELRKFVAHKGSLTVNGVALTVARVHGPACTLALIPYTLMHTNLSALKKGNSVNIEIDSLARYLAKLRG